MGCLLYTSVLVCYRKMIEDKGSFEMARVLVVDDEKLIVKGIRFSLEMCIRDSHCFLNVRYI